MSTEDTTAEINEQSLRVWFSKQELINKAREWMWDQPSEYERRNRDLGLLVEFIYSLYQRK